MAHLIQEGARFEVGQTGLEVPYATVSIGAVHSVHVATGLLNMWKAHYARRPDPPELEVVQVLIEPSRHQPRLDRAHTTFLVDRHRRPSRGRS